MFAKSFCVEVPDKISFSLVSYSDSEILLLSFSSFNSFIFNPVAVLAGSN